MTEYYAIDIGQNAIINGHRDTVIWPDFLVVEDSLQGAEEQVKMYLEDDAQENCKYNYAIFCVRTAPNMTEDICRQSAQVIKVYDDRKNLLYSPTTWFIKDQSDTADLLLLLKKAIQNNEDWEFCELIKQYRWDV